MKFNRLQFYSRQPRKLILSRSASRTPFSFGPSPPRLPKADQELYEALQRSSHGAFSAPNLADVDENSKSSQHGYQTQIPPFNQSSHAGSSMVSAREEKTQGGDAKIQASGTGEELHPDVRRGAQPEFEGEKNPKTGEIGGPKNEPLRWGGEADWSYNGRVTDF